MTTHNPAEHGAECAKRALGYHNGSMHPHAHLDPRPTRGADKDALSPRRDVSRACRQATGGSASGGEGLLDGSRIARRARASRGGAIVSRSRECPGDADNQEVQHARTMIGETELQMLNRRGRGRQPAAGPLRHKGGRYLEDGDTQRCETYDPWIPRRKAAGT